MFLVLAKQLIAQDTSVTWIHHVNPSAFTVHYDKKSIPQELFSILGIQSVADIANPGRRYQKGCIAYRNLPHKRLNWIATDSSNHWIVSVSHGGRGSGTLFYFIDKEKGDLNTSRFTVQVAGAEKLHLTKVVEEIKARRYWRIPTPE